MSAPRVETTGLEGMGEELLAETADDLLSPMARIGELAVNRVRQKLSVRGGPSRPGSPPAMDEGVLLDSIGRTAPYKRDGTITIAWGVGAGTEARARVIEHATRKGVPRESIFQAATLHEFGGIGAGGRRYPARPYIRPTEAELEPAVTAILEAALR